jgi:hypothetical protein
MHERLPPALRDWVACQAVRIGLPGPDDYILLLLRLEKQRQDLEGIGDRYDQVYRGG